jgi:hypothetical protein
MIYESNSNMLISETAALSYYQSAGQPATTEFLINRIESSTNWEFANDWLHSFEYGVGQNSKVVYKL